MATTSSNGMGDRISMPISVGSSSDETLSRGPWLLLRQRYELPFGINVVQFSYIFLYIFFFIYL